ncbi:MAG TPA: hypothetical protein VH328_07910, partial [Burkholderiaceae bacterium]|nr:hypothetical protein [Burkholderiaceae bacterium]
MIAAAIARLLVLQLACPLALAAPTCQVIMGAPATPAAQMLAAAPRAASEASSAAEAAIDLALAEPTAAGLHTGPRYDLGAMTRAARETLPQMVQWYLSIPGAQVRACDTTRTPAMPAGVRLGTLRYYPITPVWRSPSGLCHFSLRPEQDRDLMARPERNIDDDEAWRYQLFVTSAERCDSVEIERYVETVGVSDRDLATFFKMWHAFVASPVRFETALRRFEHSAPA